MTIHSREVWLGKIKTYLLQPRYSSPIQLKMFYIVLKYNVEHQSKSLASFSTNQLSVLSHVILSDKER